MSPEFALLARAGYETCRERGDRDAFLDYLFVSLRLAALRLGASPSDALLVALRTMSAVAVSDASRS